MTHAATPSGASGFSQRRLLGAAAAGGIEAASFACCPTSGQHSPLHS